MKNDSCLLVLFHVWCWDVWKPSEVLPGVYGHHQKVLLECLEVIRSTSKHSTANNQNRTNRQFLFTIIYLSVSCLEKGVYSETLCMICVDLLKLDFDWLMVAYIVLLSARSLEQTQCTGRSFYTSDQLFYSAFFWVEYPLKWCTYSTGMAGATWNCSRLGASSVYTIQPCTISLHAKPHT